MPATWIVNASPFISLAKIGRLDLLTASGRSVLVPATVAAEIAAGAGSDPAAEAALHLDKYGMTLLPQSQGPQPVNSILPSPIDPRVAPFALDAGEAAVLSEALVRPGSIAVIDDGKGRAACDALQIGKIGTLGVFLLARRTGAIAAVKPLIQQVHASGRYIASEAVLRAQLALIEETWP